MTGTWHRLADQMAAIGTRGLGTGTFGAQRPNSNLHPLVAGSALAPFMGSGHPGAPQPQDQYMPQPFDPRQSLDAVSNQKPLPPAGAASFPSIPATEGRTPIGVPPNVAGSQFQSR